MSVPESVTMRVVKYIPDRLYGFTEDENGRQVFFHLGTFTPGQPPSPPPLCPGCSPGGCTWVQVPPPPILGEQVEVEVVFGTTDGRAPRATKVTRMTTPVAEYGVVESFDPFRGYGYVRTGKGDSFHLHKVEMLERKIPVMGQKVSFYAGVRQDKPRAVHVKICP